MLFLDKYSFGMGDRFAHQARAQLRACQLAVQNGVEVTPVWNKSNREHTLIGSEPPSVLEAARKAVAALGWTRSWHVDADHIRLETVDKFLKCSDFFTIDVADSIGQPADEESLKVFMARHPELVGELEIEGIRRPLATTREYVAAVASKFLKAAQDAGKIYRHIAAEKGDGEFIAEVSMDETDSPQTPPELLIIIAALADEGVRVQTIAPKFAGRFNKGVDYVGDVKQFEQEFREDIAVLAHAAKRYQLPENLKLSVHSGSDKFSLYPVIRTVLRETGAGVHVKTAGTTWLEELIGLAESDGEGLKFAKEMYIQALEKIEELAAPYATVIDIKREELPSAYEVETWTSEEYVRALRHVPGDPKFNPSLRQLLHVSFKLAAKAGQRYLDLLSANEAVVARNVTENLYERHLRPLFID